MNNHLDQIIVSWLPTGRLDPVFMWLASAALLLLGPANRVPLAFVMISPVAIVFFTFRVSLICSFLGLLTCIFNVLSA